MDLDPVAWASDIFQGFALEEANAIRFWAWGFGGEECVPFQKGMLFCMDFLSCCANVLIACGKRPTTN